MRKQIVVYKTKPEKADENQRLIETVFAELRAKGATDMRYLSARMGDGTFVHFAISDDAGGASPFAKLESFQAYLAGIKDRVTAPPLQSEAIVIGNYRMLDE
ncbi:MAG TPA: hypothetical protein VNF99_15010 [Stellaceae bacterium]|nr:hypothetical protein [Stellaceae bacterium]